MSTLSRLQRRNLVLAVLAVALCGFVLLRGDPAGGPSETEMPLLFPEFDANASRGIEIEVLGEVTGAPQKVTLVRAGLDKPWQVTTQAGYGTKVAAEFRLLDGIGFMRERKLVTTREETFEKYASASEPWTRVTVTDGSDTVLATFDVGRTTNPYPDVFARVGEGDDLRIVQAIKVTRDMLSTAASNWIEDRVWPTLRSEQMIRVDLERPSDDVVITVARRGEAPADVEAGVPDAIEDDLTRIWWMLSPKKQDADRIKSENLGRTFTGARIKQVVADRANDEALAGYGLKEPAAKVTLFLKDESGAVAKHTLLIGGVTESGNQRYVKRADKDWIFAVSAFELSDFFGPPEALLMTLPGEAPGGAPPIGGLPPGGLGGG